MIKGTRRILGLAIIAIALADTTAEAQQRPRRDPNRITTEEIQTVTAQNVQDLIQRLRPAWFRVRGATSMQSRPVESPLGGTVDAPIGRDIVVYLDGARFGPHGQLRGLAVDAVSQLEFLDGPTATNRFGTGHPHGAILITTRK